MRFFHRGLYKADLPDEAFEQAWVDYRAHVAGLRDEIPEGLVWLGGHSLHDGVIERTTWVPHRRTLEMTILFSEANDPSAVTITYTGVRVGTQALDTLRRVSLDRATVILNTEVDTPTYPIDDQPTFVHRLLFWPRDEVAVHCADVRISVAPRSDYRVNLRPGFLEVYPEE